MARKFYCRFKMALKQSQPHFCPGVRLEHHQDDFMPAAMSAERYRPFFGRAPYSLFAMSLCW